MRRNKKLLSTVVASALVATTMAMPVMAADGGTMEIPVETKTAVLRVTVPTNLEIAVNQFEMGDTGSQIYSTDFAMENKSEIPVKVNVASTATLKSTTLLLDTKAAAAASKKAGKAWMAVAAKTAAASYADGSATGIEDLTEKNTNVATFVQSGTSATTSQTFYLKQSSTMKYKLLNAGEDSSKVKYAQFYELKAETVAADADLQALIAEKDVYVATAAPANNQDLTKVAKGGTHSYDAAEKYYTANLAAAGTIDTSKLYVYGNGDTDTAGAASFRYIGKLSGGQESWSKEDISKISIKYDIVGVGTTDYTSAAANCTYGLYKDPNYAPSIATTSYTMTAGTDLEVTVDLGGAGLAATGIESVAYVSPSGATKPVADTDYSFAGTKLTLKSAHIDAALDAGITSRNYVITFNDTAKTKVTITVEK